MTSDGSVVRGRLAWWAFLGVSAVHLAGQLAGATPVQQATKPLLMPLLAAWFLAASPATRTRTVVTVALVWSWLGDLGLMGSGDAWFLAGLGAFLVAQVTYAVAFWPWRRDSALHRPVLLAPYVVVLVGLLVVLWPDLGDLRAPVTVYAIAIVTMAVLATGMGRLVAIGAVLFVVSDALIAVGSLAELGRLPRHGFWVMVTYLAAQGAIAVGVQRRLRLLLLADESARDPRPSVTGRPQHR